MVSPVAGSSPTGLDTEAAAEDAREDAEADPPTASMLDRASRCSSALMRASYADSCREGQQHVSRFAHDVT